jgi:hypothetical protein
VDGRAKPGQGGTKEQRETAKEQRAIWLFSQSVDPRQPRISAENVMQLADNFPAEQQKQQGAPGNRLSG